MAAAGVGNALSTPIEQASLPFARVPGMELLAELYRPRNADNRLGRAVVMVHGGAWSIGDRLGMQHLAEEFARRGMSVFSLDFRDGRNGKHPCAVADIAAGIRFVRANAERLEVDPDHIGLVGSSSGGHLVLLTGIQPDVDAHRGTPFEMDGTFQDAAVSARTSYVIALWPVSDPLFRFRYAQAVGREELVAGTRSYYRDERHMAQASVQRTLAVGEAQELPPVAVVQPGADANVPQEMTLQLVRAFQRAGGVLNYLFYPGLPHGFGHQPSPDTDRMFDDLWPLVERYSRTG